MDFLKNHFLRHSLLKIIINLLDCAFITILFPRGLESQEFTFRTFMLMIAFRTRVSEKELVKEAVKLGIRNGATHMRLSVDNKNIQAKYFYEKIGMKHRSDENIFHMGGEKFLSLIKEPR